jgi:serine/threonine protein kinase
MGVVFYAEQKTKRVALKVVRNSFLDSPELKSRLEREVELMSQINSIRVAKVIDSGTDDSFAWVATEYINGPDLKEKVISDGPLNRDEWFELAKGLLEALVAVHATGVIHRDIKPSNILLADSGPKLIDFGIAQVSDATSLTATGVVAGSPAWLSPEQIHGDEITAATDIFSAGSVLVFAANGKSPWGDTTSTKTPVVFNRISNEKPDLESLSFHQKKIVEPMLVKDMKSRSQAKDLLRLISEYSKIDEEARLRNIKEQEELKKLEIEKLAQERLDALDKKYREKENEKILLKQEKEKQEIRDKSKQKRNQKINDIKKLLSQQVKKIVIVTGAILIAVPVSYFGVDSYQNKTGIFSLKTLGAKSESMTENISTSNTDNAEQINNSESPGVNLGDVQICREARFLVDGPVKITPDKGNYLRATCWGPEEQPKVGYCLGKDDGSFNFAYTLYKGDKKIKTFTKRYDATSEDKSIPCNLPSIKVKNKIDEGYLSFSLLPNTFEYIDQGDRIVWDVNGNFSNPAFQNLEDIYVTNNKYGQSCDTPSSENVVGWNADNSIKINLFCEDGIWKVNSKIPKLDQTTAKPVEVTPTPKIEKVEKDSTNVKPETVNSKTGNSKVCRTMKNVPGQECWSEGSKIKRGPCVSKGDYVYKSEFIKDGAVVDTKSGSFTITKETGIQTCIYGEAVRGLESNKYPPMYFKEKNKFDSVNTVIEGNGWKHEVFDNYTWSN